MRDGVFILLDENMLARVVQTQLRLAQKAYWRADLSKPERCACDLTWEVSVHNRAGQSSRIGLSKIFVHNGVGHVPFFIQLPPNKPVPWLSTIEKRSQTSIADEPLRCLLNCSTDLRPATVGQRGDLIRQEAVLAFVQILGLMREGEFDVTDMRNRITASTRLLWTKLDTMPASMEDGLKIGIWEK